MLCIRVLSGSIESLLSASECAAWINYGERQGFERSFHKQTSEMAHRDNGRITLHSPQVAAALFARVGSFVPSEMGRRYAARLATAAKKIGLCGVLMHVPCVAAMM